MPSTGTDSRFAPQRVADLAMRGTEGTMWSRITWPRQSSRDDAPPLLALFAGDEIGAADLCRLCSRTGLVALFARDNKWPPIVRQVLVDPHVALPPATASLAGVAPATVVSGADGGRYAERLRRAGVEVDELRHA